jgi:hypothetical protein
LKFFPQTLLNLGNSTATNNTPCVQGSTTSMETEDQFQQSLSKTSEPTRLPDEQLDNLKNTEAA